MNRDTIRDIAQVVVNLERRGDYTQNQHQWKRELRDELITFRCDGSSSYRLPHGRTDNLDVAIETWALGRRG